MLPHSKTQTPIRARNHGHVLECGGIPPLFRSTINSKHHFGDTSSRNKMVRTIPARNRPVPLGIGQSGSDLDSVRSKTTVAFVKKSGFLLLFLPFGIAAIFFSPALLGQGNAPNVQIEKAPAIDKEEDAANPSGSPEKPRSTPDPEVTAAEALYDYLQKYHIEVAKDQAGSKTVWTDRVLIEITDDLPPEPLSSLISACPTNDGTFATWVHDTFETQTKAWHPGKKNSHPAKEGTDEIVSDAAGGDHCFVNPVYLSYVLARYPTAKILIKGPTDPALFTVNGQVRAVLSTWTQLPDGTPLL
jgi:hypothetical protein